MLASFENGRLVNIVMQRMPYGTVKSLLLRNGGWLEEPLVVKITACGVRGLAYMHESDVIHRNVKPDAFLITQWTAVLQVKACDFAEAKRKGTDDYNGYIAGTEGYCSPQYKERFEYGPCTDMCSLVITLYEPLYGCLPFYQQYVKDAKINMEDRVLTRNAKDVMFITNP